MALTKLGGEPAEDTGPDFSNAFQKEIKRQAERVKDEILSEVLTQLRQLQKAPTPVNITAPNVTVAAPKVAPPDVKVNVAAPNVTVENEAGEPTDLAGVEKRLDTLGAKFDALAKALMTPVTRTVTRDARGLITSITEKRG